jgi:hypothetical protein
MKDYRFDELTKELAAKPVSRRRALRLLLAGTAAGLLSTVTAPGAYAARPCREIGQTCQSDAQCCTRFCDNMSFRCACPPCPPGFKRGPNGCECVCQEGTRCPNTNTCCPAGTQCTDAGTCCPSDRLCSGECCPPGFTCRSRACVGPPASATCGSPCTGDSACAQSPVTGCRTCRTVPGTGGARTCGGVLL